MRAPPIDEILESPDTDAFCFYAAGPANGKIGLSSGRAELSTEDEKALQTELLAFHLFELQHKYRESPQEVMREAVAIFNEHRETWREWFDG